MRNFNRSARSVYNHSEITERRSCSSRIICLPSRKCARGRRSLNMEKSSLSVRLMKWFPGINLNHSAFRLIIWSAIISFSVPILALAVNGSFSRYMADDFATAFTLHTQGFWRMQQYWYTTWSGRYAFFFVIAVLEKLGPWLVLYLPALALAARLACFYLILLPALQFFEVRHANA